MAPISRVSGRSDHGLGLKGLRQFQQSRESSWIMSDDDMAHSIASDGLSPPIGTLVPYAAGSMSELNSYANGDDEDDEMEVHTTLDTETLGFEVDTFAQHVDVQRLMYSETQTPDVIDLLENFMKDTSEHVAILKEKAMQYDGNDEAEELAFIEDAKYYDMETSTWELLEMLIKHRTRIQGNVPDMMTPIGRYQSNEHLRRRLVENDSQYHELTLILDWLRSIAPEPTMPEDEDGDLEVRESGWMYTLQTLKQFKRLHQRPDSQQVKVNRLGIFAYPPQGVESATDPGVDIVTELDPDAPTRQSRPTETDDKVYDLLFARILYGLLRRGDIAKAVKWCEECGQWWRVPVILGAFEARDSLLDEELLLEGSDPQGIPEGNRRRALWRRVCFKNARKEGHEPGDTFEKAAYAILCGDVESLLPVCEEWHDHMFANINALVESHYDNFLDQHGKIPDAVKRFPIYDATHALSGLDGVLSKIVDSLSQPHDNRFTDTPNILALRAVQGAIISDRFPALVAELADQFRQFRLNPAFEPTVNSNTPMDCTDWRLIRVVTHVLITLQFAQAWPSSGADAANGEEVVGGYIRILAAAGKYTIIPLYAAKLRPIQAINIMGEVFSHILDDKTRENIIRLFKIHGLDVNATITRAMENCLARTEPVYKADEMPKNIEGQLQLPPNQRRAVEEEDEELIRCAEWMLLVDGMKDDLVRAGIMLYKRFYLTGRMSAASLLNHRIPSHIIQPPQYEDDSFGDIITDQIAMANYMEYEFLVEGINALDEWKMVITDQPITGKRDTRRARWKDDLQVSFENVEPHLLRLVQSWLVMYADSPDYNQIRFIRNMYIPDLTIMLHHVYLSAGQLLGKSNYIKAMDLANVVAMPGNSVAECFMATGGLKRYVEALAGASVMMLGVGKGMTVGHSGTSKGNGTLAVWNVKA